MTRCCFTGMTRPICDKASTELSSILSTPLTALKKRGFNVDRLLNQEREERLRSQAEQEERKSIQRYDAEKQSLRPSTAGFTPDPSSSSIDSHSTSGPKSTVMDKIQSSILDQVAKKKPFGPGGLLGNRAPNLPQMPGAFNSGTKGAGIQAPDEVSDKITPWHEGAAGQSGRGSANGQAPGHTTKEVSLVRSLVFFQLAC